MSVNEPVDDDLDDDDDDAVDGALEALVKTGRDDDAKLEGKAEPAEPEATTDAAAKPRGTTENAEERLAQLLAQKARLEADLAAERATRGNLEKTLVDLGNMGVVEELERRKASGGPKPVSKMTAEEFDAYQEQKNRRIAREEATAAFRQESARERVDRLVGEVAKLPGYQPGDEARVRGFAANVPPEDGGQWTPQELYAAAFPRRVGAQKVNAQLNEAAEEHARPSAGTSGTPRPSGRRSTKAEHEALVKKANETKDVDLTLELAGL